VTIDGIDISSYQGAPDFDLVKQTVQFVISKASEGVGFPDSKFRRNWSQVKAKGLIRGAYHFARPDVGNSASEEATYFLSQVGPIAPEDLLGLDYEVQWDGDVVAWCREWLDLVRGMTGVVPLIYLNLALVKGYDWSSVITSGYPLWLAYYNVPLPVTPWPAVTIWQYTSNGIVPGITGRVDLNTWLEDNMGAKEIAEKVLADAGLDPKSLETLKEHLDYHIHLPLPNGKQTTIPLHPPVRDALYKGGSADFTQIDWVYPDGSQHSFVNGVEVPIVYPDLTDLGIDAVTTQQMYDQGYVFDRSKPGWVKL